MSEWILEAKNLNKIYSSAHALRDLTFWLPKGRIIGLLGPNGSGKTTLLKLAAGLLTPTSGSILIDGVKPSVQSKAMVSYLPERTYFARWMKVNDCIDYFEDFYADFDRTRALSMLEMLSVPLNRRLNTLSKGTQEKVQLVMVMSRSARLYLLDEPIAGVDPAARDFILNTIFSNYAKDATILISTHLISDIENVLDEFLFLSQGSILRYDTVEHVHGQEGKSVNDLFREVFRC